MTDQVNTDQTQQPTTHSDRNNHKFELIDGELKVVTYIADSILFDDPVYLSFIDLIYKDEERGEEPTMSFKTTLGDIIDATIERELHLQPNGDVVMPSEHKDKYDALRTQLQEAIDAIDSLTFEDPKYK